MRLGHTLKREELKKNLKGISELTVNHAPINKNVNLFDKTQQDIEKDKKTDQINQ